MKILTTTLLLFIAINTYAQTYWQQKVDYTMEIDMDVKTHQFKGVQKIVYTNNSPDTLTKVFYHLYYNAFQPGSMMDVRSRNISDPDRRVGDRISKLSDSEIGYQHVTSLKQDGKDVAHTTVGTILEVQLDKDILPGKTSTFDMIFNAQVPAQIRRTGRDNSEGVSYSMSQWYPKMAEYDRQGWHPNPYIGREFHGVWGDFDVKITIDPTYVIGGTGYLQNANKIGYGYEKNATETKAKSTSKPLTWHFKAPNVHDFAWAADPDYVHTKIQVPDGPMLHFFYQENETTKKTWSELPEIMSRAMQYVSDNYGKYPYDQYSFIQGGDGGMEYPMATLIMGNGSMAGLVSVSVHEMIHSWYQGLLATNESLYSWMDEGFTSYAQNATLQYLQNPNATASPHSRSHRGYLNMARSGNEEPMTTHADHYITNGAYRFNSYAKGAVFLDQLAYIVGKDTFMKGMKRYFNDWSFKHPTAHDFIRSMERVSGMQLDWYLEHFVYTTNQIDYGIRSIVGDNDETFIVLERIKDMMMPIDLHVTYKDGSTELIYIPLRIMRGSKQVEDQNMSRLNKEPWPWTNPTYTVKLNHNLSDIESVEIDGSQRLSDIDRSNNKMNIADMKTPYSYTTK